MAIPTVGIPKRQDYFHLTTVLAHHSKWNKKQSIEHTGLQTVQSKACQSNGWTNKQRRRLTNAGYKTCQEQVGVSELHHHRHLQLIFP
jgi:hypothetical protein